MSQGIDLSAETVITLTEAARSLPGGPVHVSTIHRWRLRGRHGVKLETFLRGGRRCTTDAALSRYFAAITAAADGDIPRLQTSRTREREIAAAERDFDANS